MNYIKHLSGFFNKVSVDDRLNPTHVSLYVSLFQFWNACRFHNPISISRQEAMNVSKISSKVTYHKCIRELHQFGYLRYEPSYNPFKGSLVYLFDFQTGTELVNKINHAKIETSTVLVPNGYRTKIETGTVQALIPYINNLNNTKQKTIVNVIAKKNTNEKNNNSKSSTNKFSVEKTKKEMSSTFADPDFSKKSSRQKLREKKKSNSSSEETQSRNAAEITIQKEVEQKSTTSGFKRPLLSEAKSYFEQNQWLEKEADKFYNHYESNGWMIGKTPMANWQAAANNWILNSQNFNNDKTNWKNNVTSSGVEKRHNAGKLYTNNSKNFSEPL